MYDSTYPLFPVCAFLGFVLALVPLPWHLEAWNSATCYFMIWSSLACLNQFINSVVWADTALNVAPVWCDISTRIIVGASVGIPASSLCINRRLYMIARVQATTITRAEKRRAIIIDTLLCVLFPMICMVLAYVVQGHRFNIYEEIGCSVAIYDTLLAYILVNSWPVLIGLISAVYCVLSLRSFAIRRQQFSQMLSSNKSLTSGRYFRLMALATTEMLLTVPISSYLIYLNATAQPLAPWVSWSYVHSDFSRVVEIPAIIWQMDHEAVVALRLGQWLNPMSAFIFFAYFGVASEARRNYLLACRSIATRLGMGRFFEKKPSILPISLKLDARKLATEETLPAYSPPCKGNSSLSRSYDLTDKLPEKAFLSPAAESPSLVREDDMSPISPTYTSLPPTPSDSPFATASHFCVVSSEATRSPHFSGSAEDVVSDRSSKSLV